MAEEPIREGRRIGQGGQWKCCFAGRASLLSGL
jgi:hypothetical protein